MAKPTKSTRLPRVGSLVQVDFWDHCQDGPTPLSCAVYGLLVAVDAKHLTVEGWTTHPPRDNTWENRTRWALSRASVHRVFRLIQQSVRELQ
jgi:hypothetical protein